MPDNLSNYLENALLNHTTGKSAMAMPSVYLGLFTSDPTDAGTGTEVTGGAYARQPIPAASWNAAANGSITTSADVTFPTATANWGTVTHIGIYDGVTAGNLLWYGPLSATKVVNNGDVFKVTAGNLTLTLA